MISYLDGQNTKHWQNGFPATSCNLIETRLARAGNPHFLRGQPVISILFLSAEVYRVLTRRGFDSRLCCP